MKRLHSLIAGSSAGVFNSWAADRLRAACLIKDRSTYAAVGFKWNSSGSHRLLFPKMKKLALTLVLLAAAVAPMWAADHIVAVSDTEFTPRVVTAQAGDTISWILVPGARGHIVASVTIPPGAEPWRGTVDAEHPTFRVLLTVSGEYRYHCSIHLFMKGAIRVRGSGQ